MLIIDYSGADEAAATAIADTIKKYNSRGRPAPLAFLSRMT
ncbi:hypothetical protein JOD97_003641 [Duganella sp. 1411]|jgi:hypothetical protein|nr:hypothetical protein [Duganella sp. 1411]MBP1205579.1 hypothetical protein [Duganella sp. 1411]